MGGEAAMKKLRRCGAKTTHDVGLGGGDEQRELRREVRLRGGDEPRQVQTKRREGIVQAAISVSGDDRCGGLKDGGMNINSERRHETAWGWAHSRTAWRKTLWKSEKQ